MHPTDLNTGTQQLGPGSVLGSRFRLASVAARTPIATIYNALDEQSRARVRVRVTLHEPDPSLMRLSHPAFPAVLGTGQGGHAHWVALEWFDGEPISLPAPDQPADRARLRGWAQVALHALEALEHLHHTAGRAHGSLGLDSLWLGRDGRPRIIDATAPDGVLSPDAIPWASPERLRGLPREPQSDLYALAALLFGLAHGGPPFGTDPTDARAGHLLRRVPDTAALTPAFLGVLRTAMDKQLDHRFSSAARMGEAMQVALGDLEPSRRMVVAPPSASAIRVRELPPPVELDEAEALLEEEALTPYGTLEPAPARNEPRHRSPAPMLALVISLGVPLSIAAWVALAALVAAMAAGLG